VPSLNRRHQVGLFLVFVVTGIALVRDVSAKETAGIALLGLAATWAVGVLSASGVLWASGLVLVGGLSATAWSVVPDWRQYHASVASYDAAIRDLRQALSEADLVSTPGVGPLRFSKEIPSGERDRTIREETENKRSDPQYEVSGTIVLPLSVRRWQNPNYAPSTLPFDENKSVDEEVRWITTDFLQPHPIFTYSRLTLGIGLTTAVLGLLGCFRARRL
jgi:hypothetical protein